MLSAVYVVYLLTVTVGDSPLHWLVLLLLPVNVIRDSVV
jgi:hypothetical protein